MKRAFIVAIAMTLMAACVGTKGPPLESRIYNLEYSAPDPAPDHRRLDCRLRIDAFDAPLFYGTDRMAYREQPFRMDQYRYHRWQAPPAPMVTRLLERDLKQAAFCLAVIDSDSLLPATHLLEGTVDDFFEDDTENGWQAVLTLSLTLSTTRTGNADPRILMQRTYRARKACRAKNPQAVAEAMSLAMADVSKHVLGDIYEQLAQQE